jgi:hypothetical protein
MKLGKKRAFYSNSPQTFRLFIEYFVAVYYITRHKDRENGRIKFLNNYR